MTERLGLIPLKKRVDEISRYYERLENSIVRILLSVQIGSSNVVKSAIASKKINRLLLETNVYSRNFARKTVPEAYEESSQKALISLKALGAEQNPRYNQKKHKKTQQEVEREMIGFYVEANQSIKKNSNIYLHLVARASKKLSSTQFFDFEESTVEIGVMVDIAYDRHKGYKYAERLIRNYLEGLVGEGNLIEINGRHYNIRKYARLVARTELRRVQTQATKNYCNEYENDLVQWSKHANPCEICAPLEGKIFSISGKHPDYPLLTEEPPIHPQCCLPGTTCITPGGLVAGLRARYNGKIIELAFSNGSQLSVSQNHLLLTPYGFVAAKFLREGDEVFQCNELGNGEKIENIFEKINSSENSKSCLTKSKPEFLHGDGLNADNILVSFVDTDSCLNYSTDEIVEHLSKDVLQIGGELYDQETSLKMGQEGHTVDRCPHLWSKFLSSLSVLFGHLKRGLVFDVQPQVILHAVYNKISSLVLSGEPKNQYSLCASHAPSGLFFPHVSSGIEHTLPLKEPSHVQGFSLSSLFHNKQNKDSHTLMAFDNDKFCKCSYKHITTNYWQSQGEALKRIAKQADVLSGGRKTSPHFLNKNINQQMREMPDFIKLKKITKVRKFNYDGFIYDLHTKSSLYYANGVLSSNCEHNINPTSESAIKFREVYG